MLFEKMMKVAAVYLLLVGVAESAAATDRPLRLGTHLNLSKVNEITDAPWGVYADGVGGFSLSKHRMPE